MESSPLVLAHTHARHAALEMKRSNPVAASEEHDLAAAEFAAAAQGTNDSEALRILNLLEQHHKKLGQILKSRHERPLVEADNSTIPQATPQEDEVSSTATTPPATLPHQAQSSTPDAIQQPPRLTRTARPTARDLSSSIASNLASARGIPSNRQRRPTPISPTVSVQHAGGKFTKDQPQAIGSPRKSDPGWSRPDSFTTNQQLSKPPWAPPTAVTDGAIAEETAEETDQDHMKAQTTDAPFQQFYATFESLISKISAPLAFAGLPLTNTPSSKPAAPPTPSVPTHKSPTSAKAPAPVQASSNPPPIDYSALISRAALRAVRGGVPSSANPAESFYIVPTTGGTISYAEIMNRADRDSNRHNRGLAGIGEGDFVEPKSTSISTDRGKSIKKDFAMMPMVNGKTMEELDLENQALKHLADTLAKRLHLFELSAQSSSAALAHSIRSLHRSPMSTPDNSGRKPMSLDNTSSKGKNFDAIEENEKAQARIAELEELLRKSDRETHRRKEENAKLKEVVVRYREKWEKLKEGARARREVVDKDKDRDKEDRNREPAEENATD